MSITQVISYAHTPFLPRASDMILHDVNIVNKKISSDIANRLHLLFRTFATARCPQFCQNLFHIFIFSAKNNLKLNLLFVD